MRIITICLITLSLFACKSKKNAVTHSHDFDKTITLAIGDSATFEDGLLFKLIRVTSDSRCPKGSNCIWAGEVIAVFSANNGEELTISSDPLKNPLKFGEYVIEFNLASPIKEDKAIAAELYRLNFKINKANIQP